jgi:hypothetical protein
MKSVNWVPTLSSRGSTCLCSASSREDDTRQDERASSQNLSNRRKAAFSVEGLGVVAWWFGESGGKEKTEGSSRAKPRCERFFSSSRDPFGVASAIGEVGAE